MTASIETLSIRSTSGVVRGCPCPVAGRSLRASCPPLTRRLLAPPSWLRSSTFYREHPIFDTCSSKVGATGVLSLDVHSGPPGLRSLRVRCASPSMASLASTARLRTPAAPPGIQVARSQEKPAPGSTPALGAWAAPDRRCSWVGCGGAASWFVSPTQGDWLASHASTSRSSRSVSPIGRPAGITLVRSSCASSISSGANRRSRPVRSR